MGAHKLFINSKSGVLNNQFKLKPISFVVLTMLAQAALVQHVQAQAQPENEAAQFKQLLQCEQSADSTQEKTDCAKQATKGKQKLSEAQIAQLRADASFDEAIAARERAYHVQVAQASLDVEDILMGDEPSKNAQADTNHINATKDIVRTAEAKDAKPAESSKPADSNNKINTPNKSLDSKTLNKKEGGNLPLDTKSKDPKAVNIQLKEVNVRAKRYYEIGPMPGLGLTKEEIPGNVQSITAKEIKESHSLSLTDLMNTHLQSVNVNDYQSNPFQMDVQYRGFTASPQLGTAQGISVFLDGIRVNEPFGDVVNWDMLPLNALKGLDVFPGSNPIFGLGTLGGALAMRTKSGFDGDSLDAEILGGSFGRKQFQISAGGNNGVIAGFASGNFFLEDGWRDNSPSKVNQVFGKAEWRNEQVQLGLSMLYAGNKLIGNGLLPEQMVDQNPKQVYTSPDETKNELLQFQLSGIWDVSDTFNVTAQIYNRKSKRKSHTSDINEHFDGFATPKDDSNVQILPGMPDVNRDGLPDYNNVAFNVAADANGNAIDIFGNVNGIDAAFDVTQLAYGSNFNDQSGLSAAAAAKQETFNGLFPDGTSGNTVLSWTNDPRQSQFDFFAPSTEPGVFNAPLPPSYYQQALINWQNKILIGAIGSNSRPDIIVNSPLAHPGGVNYTGQIFTYDPHDAAQGGVAANYTDSAGFYHGLAVLFAINNGLNGGPNLLPANVGYLFKQPGTNGVVVTPVLIDSNGVPIRRDGGAPNYADLSTNGSGVIEGTPTALITDTVIDQVGQGGALQLNWNLDKHKFMTGVSVDKSNATYESGQYLGLLDSSRNGSAAPNELGYEFTHRDKASAAHLNDFKGDGITKSIYASETWKPIEAVNLTAAARFNYTRVNNKLAVNNSIGTDYTTANFYNLVDDPTLCLDNNNDGVVDPSECPTGFTGNLIPFSPEFLSNIGSFRPAEKESFNYRSFNPALGGTWQVTDNLNLYANWNRGARTPTVIELGCAFDDTPVPTGSPVIVNGVPTVGYRPRSLAERRACSLPTTMSGDPYLKQVRSNTLETGLRGNLSPNIEWNASVYRTDLKDDIYFVSVNPELSFFQNIGKTKRQGLELGIKGKADKAHFGLNYAFTDATFQSPIQLDSPHNSSAGANELDTRAGRYEYINGLLTQVTDYQKINVKPGNRMPGVPLHNLNANFSYEVTDKWTVGLNAVMHSSAFVRGNENNKHKAGPATPIHTTCDVIDPNTNNNVQVECDIPRADFRDGKTPGYTVFNFQTSYKISPAWTFGMQINNLFDKQYASAGRLGLNAFSPATNGAVGTSGFNYNSTEWQGTSFLGTGAPRSAFFTLSYEFQPDK